MTGVNLNLSGRDAQINSKTTSYVKSENSDFWSIFGKRNTAASDPVTFDKSNEQKTNDDECISIYQKGEKEIQELNRKKYSTYSGIAADGKFEAEARKEYEKEHPEYVAAKKEYEQRYSGINEDHDRYVSGKMKEWEAQNPLNPLGTIGVLQIHDKQRSEYQKQVEAEYAKNHPEYEVLKTKENLELEENKPRLRDIVA